MFPAESHPEIWLLALNGTLILFGLFALAVCGASYDRELRDRRPSSRR